MHLMCNNTVLGTPLVSETAPKMRYTVIVNVCWGALLNACVLWYLVGITKHKRLVKHDRTGTFHPASHNNFSSRLFKRRSRVTRFIYIVWKYQIYSVKSVGLRKYSLECGNHSIHSTRASFVGEWMECARRCTHIYCARVLWFFVENHKTRAQ